MPTFNLAPTTRLEIRYKPAPKYPSHALHSAAIFGDTRLITTILVKGQPVNTYFDGITPLHAAARAGRTAIVHMLIGAGANVDAGQLPFKPYVGKEDSKVIANGDVVDFRKAWRDGYTGTEGSTPLHFAAANGHLGVLAFLLEQGADGRKVDKYGITPLMLADIGQKNVATVLRDWESKNPSADQPVSSSMSNIVVPPNNVKVKRSLDSFLPRPWKGSLLNRLFPRRSRSSASIPRLNINREGQDNLGSGSNNINFETQDNYSHRRGFEYSSLRNNPLDGYDSRDSSMLSLGMPLGLTRTNESRSPLSTCGEDEVCAQALWEQSTSTRQGWSRQLEPPNTRPRASHLVESSQAGYISCPNLLDTVPHDKPSDSPDVTPESYNNIGNEARLSPSANLQHSSISTSMSAHEIVQQLSEHGCYDITNGLDILSCGTHHVSSGGFGDVYCGSLHSGSKVAIKTVRELVPPCEDSSKSLKHAARELYVWSKCQHANVLPLLGLAVFRNQLGMVSLWMENGNLLSYLAKYPNTNRCKMCVQISDGVSYLHHTGIIHGDLKGANVVISSEGFPMLTDFGNAVLQDYTLNFTETTQKNSLSARWTAPEVMHGSPNSAQADVFALGMIILEAITGKVPFSGTKNNLVVIAAIMSRELPARPEEHIPSKSHHGDILWSLLRSCWEFEPVKRPSAADVAKSMSGINHRGLMPAFVEEPTV